MVTIESAHVATEYPNLLAGVELVEFFAKLGGRFRVPATVSSAHLPRNFSRWKEFPESADVQANAVRLQESIETLGAIPTYSCTPYLQGNLPRCGQNVSWMESSAVCYANSVLGARCNVTAMGVDVAAAIVGRVPEFGLLLDDNRAGNVLVRMEFEPRSMFQYGACGYLVGKLCSGKIPVIENMPQHTTSGHLAGFGAAAASAGGIALYHVVNVTPEAGSKKGAFKGRVPEAEFVIAEREVRAVMEEVGDLSTYKGEDIDAVLLGCPHARVDEIAEVALYLQGKRVRKDIKFCVFTSNQAADLSRRMGYVRILEDSGVDIIENDCVSFLPTKKWGWKRAMTNSAKFATLLPRGTNPMDVWFADTRRCVEVATSSRGG